MTKKTTIVVIGSLRVKRLNKFESAVLLSILGSFFFLQKDPSFQLQFLIAMLKSTHQKHCYGILLTLNNNLHLKLLVNIPIKCQNREVQPSRGTEVQPSRGTEVQPSRGGTEVQPSRGTEVQPSRGTVQPSRGTEVQLSRGTEVQPSRGTEGRNEEQ